MEKNRIRRRDFLQSAVALTGAILLGGAKSSSSGSSDISGLIKIENPFHGAVFNRKHGKEIEDGLIIGVQGDAPLRSYVTVNGIPAKREGTKFISEVVLRDKETEITAAADGWFGKNEHTVRVLWDKHSCPRYCFEIDDNIFFFRDIAQNNYNSLFDCFYLKGLRDLNRKYGTKFVLNIYYTDREKFDLTQFPDRYKGEWDDNAGWLKLAFHAYANDPARPYQHASPKQLISDFDLVNEQIHRFAGYRAFSLPTIIHWGMVQQSAYKPLAERGVRVLRGYFSYRDGRWDINCGLDDVRSEYLSRQGVLKDFESGITFSRVDMVCNNTPIDQIIPALELLKQDPGQAEIIDLMTHEQYFWPFYNPYIPDHFQRLDKAFRWLTEQSYKPVFFHEGFLGISG